MAEHPDVQTVNPEYPSRLSSVNSRIIPGTSQKLRLFWGVPYRVSRLIAPALAEIKQVYFPGEEKLVSLDVLKLYRGEDRIRQDPEDIRGTSGRGRDEIPRTVFRPERPGDKEAEIAVEELLEVPQEWNEVPDLMTEDKDVQPNTETAVKRKIDEVAWHGENGGKTMISTHSVMENTESRGILF